MKFFATASLMVSAVAAADGAHFFNGCATGLEKTVSIDPNAGHCGVTCIKPSLFPVYHIFEKWLKKADVEHPCAAAGYTVYMETATHGIPHIFTATVDLYNKPAAPQISEA